MYKSLLLSLTVLALISCSTSSDKPAITETVSPTERGNSITVAKGIIYDVIIIPQSEDTWEIEKLKGYSGSDMINEIFDAIYNGDVEVFDYHSGEMMSIRDVRRMEKSEGFERDNIGKIQFTENWYFNPGNLQIEKEILTIVPGYESRSNDGMFIGYKAAFRLDLK